MRAQTKNFNHFFIFYLLFVSHPPFFSSHNSCQYQTCLQRYNHFINLNNIIWRFFWQFIILDYFKLCNNNLFCWLFSFFSFVRDLHAYGDRHVAIRLAYKKWIKNLFFIWQIVSSNQSLKVLSFIYDHLSLLDYV